MFPQKGAASLDRLSEEYLRPLPQYPAEVVGASLACSRYLLFSAWLTGQYPLAALHVTSQQNQLTRSFVQIR
jgi:hypothetical protein